MPFTEEHTHTHTHTPLSLFLPKYRIFASLIPLSETTGGKQRFREWQGGSREGGYKEGTFSTGRGAIFSTYPSQPGSLVTTVRARGCFYQESVLYEMMFKGCESLFSLKMSATPNTKWNWMSVNNMFFSVTNSKRWHLLLQPIDLYSVFLETGAGKGQTYVVHV